MANLHGGGDDAGRLHDAIAAAPHDASLHARLGHVLFEQGDLAGAAGAYQAAAELAPGDWKTFYNLGLSLARLGRSTDALTAQRRALALNPSSPEVLTQAGLLLHKSGDNERALEMLDRAVAAAPNRFEAHYYRGVVLAAEERIAEAASAQASAVAAAPSRFEGHLAIGKLLTRLGREEEALTAYRRAVEANPAALEAHRELNNLAWELGQDVRQLGSYAFARARIGETPALLLAEAELRLRFRNADEGAKAEALLTRAGDGAAVAGARGRALLLQGRFAEAAAQFDRAIAAEPAAVSHRQDLAMAFLRDGDAHTARRVLDAAVAMAPEDQLTLGLLTLAARKLGDGAWLARMAVDDWVREITPPVPPGFADMAAFNAALAEELMALHTRAAAPMDQSLNRGSQTPGVLFARKSRLISLLEDSLRQAIAGYIAELPKDARHPFLARWSGAFGFSGSWSCSLNSSGYHTNHIHPMGWISSAYYVDLPPAVAAGQENQGALKFGQSPFGLGDDDRPSRIVTPAVGKLVLFPSYFWHGTMRFWADRPRLTVAFDVVPR